MLQQLQASQQTMMITMMIVGFHMDGDDVIGRIIMLALVTMMMMLQAVEHRSIIRVHKSGFSVCCRQGIESISRIPNMHDAPCHPHSNFAMQAQSGRVVLITESIPPNTVERYAAPEGVPVHTAQLWGTQVLHAPCSLRHPGSTCPLAAPPPIVLLKL